MENLALFQICQLQHIAQTRNSWVKKDLVLTKIGDEYSSHPKKCVHLFLS